jgi:hypothetical protein
MKRILLTGVVAALAAAGAADASGAWRQISTPQQSSTSQIGTLRTNDGVLHVAWQQRTGPNAYGLLHTGIRANGISGVATPVVSGFVGVYDAALARVNGRLEVFFTGQRSTDTSDPFIGLLRAFTPDGGMSWGLGAPVARTPYVHGRTASITSNGWLQTWYEIGETVVHAGHDPSTPLTRLYPGGSTACCAYQQNIAASSTQAVVAWCSGISAPSGLWAQAVHPTTGAALGASMLLPSSRDRICDAAGRVPLVLRVGGGFYVAETVGRSANRVGLWRVGSSRMGIMASGNAAKRTVALAAAPDGRLWVAWTQFGSSRIFFRRSNRATTIFGEVVSLVRPRNQIEATELDIVSQGDRLDVLARYGAIGGVTLFHNQVYPGLTLRVTGTDVARFRVTDAGDPVRGATVKVGRRTVQTNGAGVATLDLPRGRYLATASKAEYVSHTARFRIRR